MNSNISTIKKQRAQALIGFSYFLGLVCASFLSGTTCFISACLLGAAFTLLKRFNICNFRRHILTAAAALLIFGIYSIFIIEPVRSLEGSTVYTTGTVTERTAPSNDTVRLTVSGEAGGVPVKFTLYTTDSGVEAGDKIAFTADFSQLGNAADFSEEDYYFSRGIFIKARAKDEVTVLSHSFSFSAALADFSDNIKSRIRTVLSDEESGVLCAIFFGDKTGLSAMQSVLLRRAGLSHIAAVSGMHLSLIVHTIRMLFLDRLKHRRLLRSMLTEAMIILLMMFFGMTSSVLRAGIMLLIYYGGELFLRKSDPLNSVGSALLVILVFQPWACRDIGLWLSVLGTLGVGVVAPRVSEAMIHSEKLRSIKESIIGSASALFCTFPVSMLYFGGVSLISPISTLLIYPAFMAAMLLMLLNLFTGGFFTEVFMLPAGFCARAINFIFYTFGRFPYGYVETKGTFWQQLAVITAFGMLAFTGKLKYFIRFCSVSLCVIISAAVFADILGADKIEISFYSDGSDGMAVIKSRSGVSFLSTGDSGKITSEMLSHGIGNRVLLVCSANSEDNNIPALSQLDAIELYTPESPDKVYDISGEYTVMVKDGGIYLDVRGISVSLTKIGTISDSDFAVYSGYRKNYELGVNYSEIFLDKRMKTGHNAYYDKISITIDKGGNVLFLEECTL